MVAAVSGPLLAELAYAVLGPYDSDHYDAVNDLWMWCVVVVLGGAVAVAAWAAVRRRRRT